MKRRERVRGPESSPDLHMPSSVLMEQHDEREKQRRVNPSAEGGVG